MLVGCTPNWVSAAAETTSRSFGSACGRLAALCEAALCEAALCEAALREVVSLIKPFPHSLDECAAERLVVVLPIDRPDVWQLESKLLYRCQQRLHGLVATEFRARRLPCTRTLA